MIISSGQQKKMDILHCNAPMYHLIWLPCIRFLLSLKNNEEATLLESHLRPALLRRQPIRALQNTSSSSSSTTGINNRSCANGLDDDKDGLFDVQDPECHFDFNAFNFSSYNPGGKELNAANVPPTTVQAEETVDTDDDSSGSTGGTGVWEEIDWVPQYSN